MSLEMVADPPEDGGISEPDALVAETAEGVSSSHGFKPLSEQGHGSDLYLQY
jgi:hypothetical protein